MFKLTFIFSLKEIFKKSLFKSTLIYLSGSTLNKLIPFLTLPIITNKLSPDEYGKWVFFAIAISILLPLTGSSYTIEVFRKYYSSTQKEVAKLVSTHIMIIVVCVLLAGIILLLSSIKYSYFFSSPAHPLIIPILLFKNLRQLLLNILRLKSKPITFFWIDFLEGALAASVYLYLILFLNYGWEAIVFGYLFAELALFAVSLVLFKMWGYLSLLHIEQKAVVKILKSGIPMLPHTLGTILLASSDKFIIQQISGLNYVGIYAIGAAVGGAINHLTGALNKAIGPWLMEKLSNPSQRNKNKIVYFTLAYALALIFCVIGITLLGWFYIYGYIDKSYHGAAVIVPFLASAAGFHGLYTLFSYYPVHQGKTLIFTYRILPALLLNIPLTIFLTFKMGIVGAALGTAISQVFSLAFIYIYAQKHYPMPYIATLKSLVFNCLSGKKN